MAPFWPAARRDDGETGLAAVAPVLASAVMGHSPCLELFDHSTSEAHEPVFWVSDGNGPPTRALVPPQWQSTSSSTESCVIAVTILGFWQLPGEPRCGQSSTNLE